MGARRENQHSQPVAESGAEAEEDNAFNGTEAEMPNQTNAVSEAPLGGFSESAHLEANASQGMVDQQQQHQQQSHENLFAQTESEELVGVRNEEKSEPEPSVVEVPTAEGSTNAVSRNSAKLAQEQPHSEKKDSTASDPGRLMDKSDLHCERTDNAKRLSLECTNDIVRLTMDRIEKPLSSDVSGVAGAKTSDNSCDASLEQGVAGQSPRGDDSANAEADEHDNVSCAVSQVLEREQVIVVAHSTASEEAKMDVPPEQGPFNCEVDATESHVTRSVSPGGEAGGKERSACIDSLLPSDGAKDSSLSRTDKVELLPAGNGAELPLAQIGDFTSNDHFNRVVGELKPADFEEAMCADGNQTQNEESTKVHALEESSTKMVEQNDAEADVIAANMARSVSAGMLMAAETTSVKSEQAIDSEAAHGSQAFGLIAVNILASAMDSYVDDTSDAGACDAWEIVVPDTQPMLRSTGDQTTQIVEVEENKSVRLTADGSCPTSPILVSVDKDPDCPTSPMLVAIDDDPDASSHPLLLDTDIAEHITTSLLDAVFTSEEVEAELSKPSIAVGEERRSDVESSLRKKMKQAHASMVASCNEASAIDALANDTRSELAAAKIQAAMRGKAARRRAEEVKRRQKELQASRAEIVQHARRASLTQADRELQDASLRIQAAYRGRLGRRDIAAERAFHVCEEVAQIRRSSIEERDAAKATRAHKEQLKNQAGGGIAEEDDESKSVAILKIQAENRGKKGREEVKDTRRQSSSTSEKEEAIRRIQAAYRGKEGRSKVNDLRELKNLQNEEACAPAKAVSTCDAEPTVALADGKKKEIPSDSSKEDAIRRIQAAQRGRAGRKRADEKKNDLVSDVVSNAVAPCTDLAIGDRPKDGNAVTSNNEQEAAIVRIQAARRGTLGRRKAKDQQMQAEEQARSNGAAARLQSSHASAPCADIKSGDRVGDFSSEQEAAILRIQAARRGAMGRRKAKDTQAQAERQARRDRADVATGDRNNVGESVSINSEQEAAILRIQAARRGTLGRRKAKDQQVQVEQQARSNRARMQSSDASASRTEIVSDERVSDVNSETLNSEQEAAILRIQAARRGTLGRRKAKDQQVQVEQQARSNRARMQSSDACASRAEIPSDDRVSEVNSATLNSEQEAAILRIQAARRGAMGRRKAKDTQVQVEEQARCDRAAARIQASVRGKVARKSIVAQRKKMEVHLAEKEEIEERRRHDAAVKIQKISRGWRARQSNNRKKRSSQEETAACRIQAICRGNSERKQFRHKLKQQKSMASYLMPQRASLSPDTSKTDLHSNPKSEEEETEKIDDNMKESNDEQLATEKIADKVNESNDKHLESENVSRHSVVETLDALVAPGEYAAQPQPHTALEHALLTPLRQFELDFPVEALVRRIVRRCCEAGGHRWAASDQAGPSELGQQVTWQPQPPAAEAPRGFQRWRARLRAERDRRRRSQEEADDVAILVQRAYRGWRAREQHAALLVEHQRGAACGLLSASASRELLTSALAARAAAVAAGGSDADSASLGTAPSLTMLTVPAARVEPDGLDVVRQAKGMFGFRSPQEARLAAQAKADVEAGVLRASESAAHLASSRAPRAPGRLADFRCRAEARAALLAKRTLELAAPPAAADVEESLRCVEGARGDVDSVEEALVPVPPREVRSLSAKRQGERPGAVRKRLRAAGDDQVWPPLRGDSSTAKLLADAPSTPLPPPPLPVESRAVDAAGDVVGTLKPPRRRPQSLRPRQRCVLRFPLEASAANRAKYGGAFVDYADEKVWLAAAAEPDGLSGLSTAASFFSGCSGNSSLRSTRLLAGAGGAEMGAAGGKTSGWSREWTRWNSVPARCRAEFPLKVASAVTGGDASDPRGEEAEANGGCSGEGGADVAQPVINAGADAEGRVRRGSADSACSAAMHAGDAMGQARGSGRANSRPRDRPAVRLPPVVRSAAQRPLPLPPPVLQTRRPPAAELAEDQADEDSDA
eukprot:TRINITY_DN6433_c0_g2_i4.p1 TRINITY_DN6433_c0_g2~~TRINITY_DN6433_c0_g2_i4.p1  ORF type:complete len:2132 (+),score=435.57 TRINITY_DN6433_c0_g2_i4:455-6397(+)